MHEIWFCVDFGWQEQIESRGFFLIKEFLGERLCNNMREEAQDLFRCVRCLHGCLNMSKVKITRLAANRWRGIRCLTLVVLVVWCDRSGQFYKSFSNQEDGSRIDKKNVYAMELDGEAQISSHPEWRPLRLFRLIGTKLS